ncbi:MAG: cytochrome ubiquinol oxidase subunit I, partial [Actinomycetes bacterium]
MTERRPRLQPVTQGSVVPTPAPLASTFLEGEGGQTGDAVAVLRWGVLRYAWLVLLCAVIVGVLLPIRQLGQTPKYTAEALVVAVDLNADVKVLPRYGAAVFNDGLVAREIINQFGDGGDPEDVVPRRASVVVEQDSLVMRVEGHARDAQTSADIANVAAEVFARELNKAGSGIGAFAMQSEAIPPVESDEPLHAAPYALSVGLVAGILTGMGVLMLLLSWGGSFVLRKSTPRWLLWAFAGFTFSGWVATLAGWMVTEIG